MYIVQQRFITATQIFLADWLYVFLYAFKNVDAENEAAVSTKLASVFSLRNIILTEFNLQNPRLSTTDIVASNLIGGDRSARTF